MSGIKEKRKSNSNFTVRAGTTWYKSLILNSLQIIQLKTKVDITAAQRWTWIKRPWGVHLGGGGTGWRQYKDEQRSAHVTYRRSIAAQWHQRSSCLLVSLFHEITIGLLCCITLYYFTFCNTTLHYATLYYSVFYTVYLYCVALITLCYVTLHYIVLF